MFSAIRNVIHDCTNQRRRRDADEDEQEKSTGDENGVDCPSSKAGDNVENAAAQTNEKEIDLYAGHDERPVTPTPPTPPPLSEQSPYHGEPVNELSPLTRQMSWQLESLPHWEPMCLRMSQMLDDEACEDRLRCSKSDGFSKENSNIRRWRPVRCGI